ncbi:MAG: hypothetical protein ACLQAH_06705 [Limisphaerales bacterium]
MNSLQCFPSKGKWCAVAVFTAANLAALPASAAAIPVQSVCTDSDGVALTMSPGQDFAVTNHSWPATSFHVADSSGTIAVATRKLEIAVYKAAGAVAFYDASGKLLLAEPAAGGKTMTAATVNGESSFQPEQSFASPADEFIYGLGQFQEGIWNWRGMPQQLRQLNTQIAIPMIVSSYGYGLLWNPFEFHPIHYRL